MRRVKMMKVSIADSLFMGHRKAAFSGGTNDQDPEFFEWEPADAQSARFVTDSDIKHARGAGQVAWLLEPWELHPENYIEAERKGFDKVLTHDRRFVEQKRWTWYAHGGSSIAKGKWGMMPKDKKCSMLISDKDTLEGHRLRHEVAKRFGDRVDVYGQYEYVSSFQVYAPYQYSIVVENHAAAWYFTERLIDCFCVGTVPIYWGCPDLERFFWHSGVIQVYDVEQIGKALEMIETEKFDVHNDGIARNFELAGEYAVCEDWLFRYHPELFV